MNNLRKHILHKTGILLCLLAVLGMIRAGTVPAFAEETPGEGPLQITVTIFAAYDWVLNILGDNPAGIHVKYLYAKGVDPHSFQPTAGDIVEISASDLFIYTGGESDDWVRDVIKEAVNPDLITLNLMEELEERLLEEESVSRRGEGEDSEDGSGDEEPEYDEHIWLSPKNAVILCRGIEQAIIRKDPENAAVYQANADQYLSALEQLDQEIEDITERSRTKTLLFADRFPFLYLTGDYGLDYYAAFDGCSAETEASFETILFLIDKIDELALHTVLVIENADRKLAQTIISNTKTRDQQILVLNSLQSVSQEDLDSGNTYLSIMKENANVLKEALN